MTGQEEKRQLEQSFWNLLAERHPLTRWWWGDGPLPRNLFCEWGAAAFQRDEEAWGRLAQASAGLHDAEASHWGRFARLAVMRIRAKTYRSAGNPLRYANLVLTLVAVHGGSGTDVLTMLGDWLPSVTEVSCWDMWQRYALQSEARRLIHTVRAISGNTSHPVETIVRDYAARAAVESADAAEPPSWVHSAHVSLAQWRDRRGQMSQDRPVMLRRPMGVKELFAPERMPPVPLKRSLRRDVAGWWIKPGVGGDTLVHGGENPASVTLGVILGWWRARSGLRDLTWALTPPPILEGGLMAAVGLVRDEFPHWAPVDTGFLTRWQQERHALAVADAWLWAEGANEREVLRWLSRYLPHEQAVDFIPWLTQNPGYYILAYQVEQLMAQTPVEEEHPLWRTGPIMPYELFVAPET